MERSDIAELKRRLKIQTATFTRVAGCYVNGEGERICTFNRSFATLTEDETFKYLELAGKLFSGRFRDNLLDMEFPLSEEKPGGKQQSLLALRDSGLEQEELLSAFYDHVTSAYRPAGNYLILLFFDRYDVPVKTKDRIRNDESEEVYSYILCGLCPVELSKPGLSYRDSENTIAVRTRDWVVEMPETGFLFPAFNDRSSDIHSCMFYTKNAREPSIAVRSDVLGLQDRKNRSRREKEFRQAVEKHLPEKEREKAEEIYSDVQYALDTAARVKEMEEGEGTALNLSPEVLGEALEEAGIPESCIGSISRAVAEILPEEELSAEDVLRSNMVRRGEIRHEKKQLVEVIREKEKELKDFTGSGDRISVFLPEEICVEVRELDGRRYVLIPVDEREVYVNRKPVE